MPKIWTSIFILFLLTFTSCKEESNEINFTTGLIGRVAFGMGDCMPIIDESSRVYHLYNGELYFIVKSELDALGNGDFEELKANSIRKTIINGVLNTPLPTDTFLVMPSDVYLYSDNNTIIIQEDDIVERDFKFFKCTSY